MRVALPTDSTLACSLCAPVQPPRRGRRSCDPRYRGRSSARTRRRWGRTTRACVRDVEWLSQVTELHPTLKDLAPAREHTPQRPGEGAGRVRPRRRRSRACQSFAGPPCVSSRHLFLPVHGKAMRGSAAETCRNVRRTPTWRPTRRTTATQVTTLQVKSICLELPRGLVLRPTGETNAALIHA